MSITPCCNSPNITILPRSFYRSFHVLIRFFVTIYCRFWSRSKLLSVYLWPLGCELGLGIDFYAMWEGKYYCFTLPQSLWKLLSYAVL